MYTVKQLSELADVSVRTLHYYDEIGLLRPSKVGSNGYRYYDDAALLRLQQILLYREMGMELQHIRDVLDDPGFDLLTALRAHRGALEERVRRLRDIIRTVDSTIMDIAGEVKVSKKQLFKAFSAEKQKEYEREARLQYGPQQVNESVRRWNSYSKAQKDAIMQEGNRIYLDIIAAIEAGTPGDSAEVQAMMARWHEHLRHFYEPTLEILRGLGELYNTHPDFIANFRQMHPELATYIRGAINVYVDALETAELERLYAEDEAARRLGKA